MQTKKRKKLRIRLAGEGGNVFSIIGKISSALRAAGLKEEAEEYVEACFNASSYKEVLEISSRYADFR